MTRPSLSLNWYEPGASGIVPAGGRCGVTRSLSLGWDPRHDRAEEDRVGGAEAPAGGLVVGAQLVDVRPADLEPGVPQPVLVVEAVLADVVAVAVPPKA